MRKRNFKAQLMVSGIFIGTLMAALTALFWQALLPQEVQSKGWQSQTVRVPPVSGHWLKTGMDNWYRPEKVDSGERRHAQAAPKVLPVYSVEKARTALNRVTDSINVMYIWSDKNTLKVISVTGFNRDTKQAAIVVIPLYTVVDTANEVNPGKRKTTIQDLYREGGREAVRRFLEERLEVAIPNYVHVNQSALQKVSDIIGTLDVNGDKITMLEAFEQTAAGIRTDDSDVVKTVASQVRQPRMILEIPRLLWIFTHDIQTNFTTDQMVNLFYISRQMDLQHMRKTTLSGFEYVTETLKLLFVPDQTWKNIIYEITQDR